MASCESAEHQARLDDTPAWWPLTAVQSWIMTRDLSAVVRLCRARSGIEKGAGLLFARAHSIQRTRAEDARQTVIAALGAEKVIAYGDLMDGRRLQPIPAAEWSRLEFFYEDGPDRAGPYQSVAIARADVLRRWPEQDRHGKVTPSSAQSLPPPTRTDLVKFLIGYADGEKTEEECKRAAKEHFKRRIPEVNRWRPAWREVPTEKKRSRGDRKS